MKTFVCCVLLAAAVLGASEEDAKRDKRGYLGGAALVSPYGLGYPAGLGYGALSYGGLGYGGLGYGSLGYGGLGYGYGGLGYRGLGYGGLGYSYAAPVIAHTPVIAAPAVVAVKKVVPALPVAIPAAHPVW